MKKIKKSAVTIKQLQEDNKFMREVFQIHEDFSGEFAEAFEFFMNASVLSSRSINTIWSYYLNLKTFFTYIEEHYPMIKSLDQLKPIHISRFYIYSQSTLNNASSTIQKRKNVLSMFFSFLVEQGFISHESNPIPSKETLGIRTKNIQKEPIFLEHDDITLFFNEISKTRSRFLRIRDRIMFGLLIYSGVRLSELRKLNLDDIEHIRENGYLRIRGKGNKARTIYVKPDAFTTGYLSELDTYLEARKVYVEKLDLEDNKNALIISSKGYRLCDRQIQLLTKKYSAAASIHKNVTPHKFRHTFATNLLKNGVNIKIVQELLGHESIATTQIYVHVTSNELSDAVAKLDV